VLADARHPKFRSFVKGSWPLGTLFPLFLGQACELHQLEAVCLAFACAQKTPQTPGKTLIFEKPAFKSTHAMCFVLV